MTRDELREKLAEFEHDRWSRWMNHQSAHATLASGERHPASGELYTERWARLAETPYSDLTDRERQSDREIADRIMAIVDDAINDNHPQRWTAVTPETLPEDGRDVLAWWPDLYYGVAHRGSTGQWWRGPGDGSPCSTPQYWMPLPPEPMPLVDIDEALDMITSLRQRLQRGQRTYEADISQLLALLTTVVTLSEREVKRIYGAAV